MHVVWKLGLLPLITGLTITVETARSNDKELKPPPGIKPFKGAIELRFRPVKHFSYYLDEYSGGKKRYFLYGFAMKGNIKKKDKLLVWTYKIYNHGLDKKYRRCGEAVATTDHWGKIVHGKVISNLRSCHAEKIWLNAEKFQFPLRSLPRKPVKMGKMDIPKEELPNFPEEPLKSTHEKEAVGLLKERKITYLVIRSATSVSLKKGDLVANGYSLIDVNNGMTRFAVRQIASGRLFNSTMVRTDY